MLEKAKAVFAGPHQYFIQGENGILYSGGFGNEEQLSRRGPVTYHTTKEGVDEEGKRFEYPNVSVAYLRDVNAGSNEVMIEDWKYTSSVVRDILLPGMCIKVAPGKDHCLLSRHLGAGGWPSPFSIGSNKEERAGLCKSVDRVLTFEEVAYFRDKGLHVTDVTCGYTHSCVVTEDGSLYTFGCNHEGQLGKDADIVDYSSPSSVQFPMKDGVARKFGEVAAGSDSTIAIATTRTPFRMGQDSAIGRDEDSRTRAPEQFDFGQTLCVYRIHVGIGHDHSGLSLGAEKG
eukprot:scaffold4860_cov171-Amphora_coffeaeformis.AAC.12